ncbi:MAG: winged helix-turn-helix transcriptional regulator [Faecousia sp.]
MEKATNCPVETTLGLIGGKYKALILWHLADGKLRFSELQKRIGSATAKMLTQQLREMEGQDLISRQVYPVVPPRVEYSLTELGKSLLPILMAMRDWGANYMQTQNTQASCFMMGTNPVLAASKSNNVKGELTV